MTERERLSGTGQEAETTARRKEDHIRIVLEEQVAGKGIDTGFDRYRFLHNALPELRFQDIDTTAKFLGKTLRAPFLVSSMTGGTGSAEAINLRLAEAAESHGWAMGLGSMRAAIENGSLADTFRVRRAAPTIPIVANLGAVQLNLGYGVDECKRVVELAEADALVLHLNGLQEVFQPEGDTDFGGLLRRIEEVCRNAGVPVGVKEVGWGIDGVTAARLADAGAAFIDCAGAGGTSWSQVEKHRAGADVRAAAAEAFADWGIPTAECITDIRRLVIELPLIASGGMETGVDAAKAIALGANLAGYGRTLLPRAASGVPELRGEALDRQFERIGLELRAAMFGIGAATLADLRGTCRLVRKADRGW